MVRIPTLIPESVADTLGSVLSGPVLEILWRLFVGTLFVGLIYALAAMGVFGALVAGALFSTLFSDDVRALVIDVWRRDFWVWRV